MYLPFNVPVTSSLMIAVEVKWCNMRSRLDTTVHGSIRMHTHFGKSND